MDYIYDIVLNFQDEYYEFYEWVPSDKIINVKRLPIYKIESKDYLNIKNYTVTIDKHSLPKTSKIFLLTNGIEVFAVLISSAGKVLKKSSLIFEEADDILLDKDHIKNINIKYKINSKHKNIYLSRINKEKNKYIIKYLKDNQDNKYYLKYLYYEIYNIDLDDISKIYNDLINLSKKDISKLYSSIKKVNLELNKP